ncbi:hypothetical protein MTR_3g467540 [Medicago truncatula]|uniref:Uncharacterized protein n=1 Tax=Medicago truncatula TaxID=3880 RepID=A0A072UYJ0_MEDTR|nr:hypothetical protein MTR_3g467540 [Medicago truncatula]
MNLFKKNISDYNDSLCTATCGFSTTFHGSLIEHRTQFGSLGGFFNKSRLALNIIWISILFNISKDRNRRHFHMHNNIRSFKLIKHIRHNNMINIAKNVKDESANKLTSSKLIACNGKMPTNNMIKSKSPEYTHASEYFRIRPDH